MCVCVCVCGTALSLFNSDVARGRVEGIKLRRNIFHSKSEVHADSNELLELPDTNLRTGVLESSHQFECLHIMPITITHSIGKLYCLETLEVRGKKLTNAGLPSSIVELRAQRKFDIRCGDSNLLTVGVLDPAIDPANSVKRRKKSSRRRRMLCFRRRPRAIQTHTGALLLV